MVQGARMKSRERNVRLQCASFRSFRVQDRNGLQRIRELKKLRALW